MTLLKNYPGICGQEQLEVDKLENKLILSKEAKRDYLQKLSKRCIKILYLIEDEGKGINKGMADDYIVGQLFEVNSANILFDGELIDVIVKLNGIRDYSNQPYNLIRKQVFETKGIIDHLLKTL